ncbi:hypothetical protein HA39_20165 [Pantoea brenneri]|nr:hypothetical protein HA39_20165 [Pantoea brenneri]
MNIRHLDGKISFSDAPSHQEFLALGEQGYDLVLNNRPDEEEGEFLLHAQEKALAEQQDITYVYLPFTFDSLTWETVYTFNRLIRRGKKTLAHCRSGSRSVALYLLYELNEAILMKHLSVSSAVRWDLMLIKHWPGMPVVSSIPRKLKYIIFMSLPVAACSMSLPILNAGAAP